MMRYVDKTIATFAGLLLAALIVYQMYDVIGCIRRARLEVDSARRLKARADRNTLNIPPTDITKHSGRVFKVWEETPLAIPFHAADFYHDVR